MLSADCDDEIEIWRCDFAEPGGWAGAIEFGLSTRAPARGAWYRFLITETVAPPRRRSTIFVADDQLRFPPPGSLEVRGSGIWSELAVQQPGEHLTADLEAFGVDVGVERELSALIYGVRVAVGCELSFETAANTQPERRSGAGTPCRVTGELLIDQDVIELDAYGWRHRTRGLGTGTVRGWVGGPHGPEFFAREADGLADGGSHHNGDRFALGAASDTAASHGAAAVVLNEQVVDGSSSWAWQWI